MKRLVLATLCLAATVVYADGQSEEVIDELEIRLSEMEVIDVTAEKQPAESQDPVDEDIEALLDELDAIEDDE